MSGVRVCAVPYVRVCAVYHVYVCCACCVRACAPVCCVLCVLCACVCACVGEVCACVTSACICVWKPHGIQEPGSQRVLRVDGPRPPSSLVCTQGWCSGLLAGTRVLRITQPPLTRSQEGPSIRGETGRPPTAHAGARQAGEMPTAPAPPCCDPGPGQTRAPCLSFPTGGGPGRVPCLVCVAVAETHQRSEPSSRSRRVLRAGCPAGLGLDRPSVGHRPGQGL